MGCTAGNQLTSAQIEQKVYQCEAIVITMGKEKRTVLNKKDSLYSAITSFLLSQSLQGIYNSNNLRNKGSYKLFLVKADNTILDLTVLDHEAGALIYQGNWLIGQDILIYDSQLIKPIREALK